MRRPDIGDKELTDLALGVGRQYVAQTRVRSNESVSTLLFATARQVVADQDLIGPGPDLAERRVAFRRELRDIVRDFDYVEPDRAHAIRRPRGRGTSAGTRQAELSSQVPRPYAWVHDAPTTSR